MVYSMDSNNIRSENRDYKNATDGTNMLYTDGQEPSEFAYVTENLHFAEGTRQN